MKTEQENLSQLLNRWLRSKKITQTELAQKLGISQASLSMMFSGKANLPKKRLQEIIMLLEPPLEEAQQALILYCSDNSMLNEFQKSKKSLSHIGFLAQLSSNIFMSDQLPIAAELNLDLTDTLTHDLLRFWRDMSTSQRYLLLAKASEINHNKGENNERKD